MLDQARVGCLDGRRDADAAQLATLLRFTAARRKPCIVRELEAIFEVLAEVPAVIGVDQRRAVRHGARRDHVAAAKLPGGGAQPPPPAAPPPPPPPPAPPPAPAPPRTP